jgi:hypothetical protein
MATMPGTIKVGRFHYTVVNDVEGFADLSAGDLGVRHTDHGATNHHRLLCAVNPHDHVQQQADTLLHEVLHMVWFVAVMDDAGSTEQPTNEREESIIARMTPWLSLTLAENPGLQAFLQNPEG